jgi:hypothetical protein
MSQNKICSKSPPKMLTKRVHGDAAIRLAKASARMLRDNSDQIIKTLYERTLAGDLGSGKLLLAFLTKLPQLRSRRKRVDDSRN